MTELKRSKKKMKLKKWQIIILSIVAGLLLVIGGYAWWLLDSLDGLSGGEKNPRITAPIPNTTTETPTPVAPEPPIWEGKERVNILLIGADARDQETPRADTMLIASIDPETKKATLMSIMRDTYLSIPGYGMDRANAAYPLGGTNLVVQTISEWTGLEIQYYVYTDFQGFIKLIDALGGIEFEVEKDMKYTDNADGNRFDINLKKGRQLLDGNSALQYVRFRHDAMSDFSRTKRQRELLTAVADKMKSGWSIIQLPHLINQISPYVDTNLTVSDMIKLGSLGLGLRMNPNLQLPPSEMVYDKIIYYGKTEATVLGVRDGQDVKTYIQEELKEDASSESSTDIESEAISDAQVGTAIPTQP